MHTCPYSGEIDYHEVQVGDVALVNKYILDIT